MDISLKGKQAVICGSTQGIGKATAIELAELGASVTLFARNESALATVLQELDVSHGQNHDFISSDFNDTNSVKQTLETYSKSKEAVHILVNNTGGPAPGNIFDATTDEFLKAFSSHLICNQYLVQSFVPLMKKANYGRIINVISTSVKVPISGLGVSNTIRGAVASWAKTLSRELAPFNITVNNILPGLTKTGRLKSIIEKKAAGVDKSVDEITFEMETSIPIKRFAEPNEVANAIAFLASPSASYITGINLPIDGGNTPCL